MDQSDRQLRFEVINFWLDNCRPPTAQDLASKSGRDEADVRRGLKHLEELHHLKLYGDEAPSPTPIAMAHPFSHLPTPYLVKAGDRSWWANCAWCAFGLASMLYPNSDTAVEVHALTASSGSRVIRVDKDGTLAGTKTSSTDYSSSSISPDLQSYHVVFSAPPSRWWADVRFACSTIQLCTTRAEAEAWHRRHGFYEGDVMSLATLWGLAKAWYHDKHTYEYERKTEEQKEALFKDLGLTSAYWSS